MLKRKVSETESKTIVNEYYTLQASIKVLKLKKESLPKEALQERMKFAGEIAKLEQRYEIAASNYHNLPDSDTQYMQQRKIASVTKNQPQISVFFIAEKENIDHSKHQQMLGN